MLSAVELKRAADALHKIAESARQRNLQRSCAEAQALVRGESPRPSEGGQSQKMTPEEESDFWDECLEPVALMLLAFAIENLLKAILVRHGLVVMKNGRLEIPGPPHSLKDLAGRCRIAVDQREETALNVLSHYSKWAGRYMAPMTLDQYREYWHHQEQGETRPEPEVLQRLYERFYSRADPA